MEPVLRHNVEKIANNYVSSYANLFKSHLSEDKQISRTLANSMEALLPYSHEQKMEYTISILERTFMKHPNYRAIYASWERKYIDPNWTKDYGRVRITLYKPPTSITDISNVTYDTLNTFGDDLNSSYYLSKINHIDELADPYEDEYNGKYETVTSVFNPLTYNGKFLGSTGIDIPFSRYAEIISKAEKFHNSNIFLLSNNAVFVGNQTKEMVGKPISEYIIDSEINIKDKVKTGDVFSIYTNIKGVDYYVTFYPFTITGTETPWSVGVAIPKADMSKEMKKNFKSLLIVGFLGLITMIIVIYFLIRGISGPISTITDIISLMAEGKINKVTKIETKRGDEIGNIINSANKLITNLQNTADFAKKIGEGELSTEFDTLSSEDVLGNSLLNMRKDLKSADEEALKRREEEEKQNWATVGFAKFGDLLRQNTDNMETFTYNVVSALTKYSQANQGAFFILNSDDDEQYLSMSSCYAYDRKKFVDKRITIGEGLVGQCFIEGQTIYMTDIPSDYVDITSGLGQAVPSALIIVPLKFNDKVYGVIELASFNNFENYQIEFIEKLAESIASTISTVQVNLQTAYLLEESKLKSEELAAQEEEMRQNMEELQTTQEESARREVEMNGVLNALNSSYIVVELDLNGQIMSMNENAKRILNSSSDAEGSNLREFIPQEELSDFEELWQKVIGGESVKIQRTILRSNKKIIISESYTPVFDEMDEIHKILNLGVEIV